MKKAFLTAYENIKGVKFKDLNRLNAKFESPIECFEDTASDEEILEFFKKTYAAQIKSLFDVKLLVRFV